MNIMITKKKLVRIFFKFQKSIFIVFFFCACAKENYNDIFETSVQLWNDMFPSLGTIDQFSFDNSEYLILVGKYNMHALHVPNFMQPLMILTK